MRRSFLVGVAIVTVAGLGPGMLAGCAPWEDCHEVRTCGGKTLSSCSMHTGCRYKSSDGQSWSCNATESSSGPSSGYNDLVSCTSTSCKIAAQEASDWCFSQSTPTGGKTGTGGATGPGGSAGSGGGGTSGTGGP